MSVERIVKKKIIIRGVVDYVMVEFVKPHLLGTKEEYKNRFATPIENGQYHDSRPEDIKLMKKRTHVLTKLLKKTIHVGMEGLLTWGLIGGFRGWKLQFYHHTYPK